jgi:hypothetical protein
MIKQARHLRSLPLRRIRLVTLAGRVTVAKMAIRMPHPMPVPIQARRFLGRIGDVSRAYSKQTFDAADDATDGSANHRSDGTGLLVADIGSMRDAVRNALRLRREWRAKRYDTGYK